jgi:hypothetical protein
MMRFWDGSPVTGTGSSGKKNPMNFIISTDAEHDGRGCEVWGQEDQGGRVPEEDSSVTQFKAPPD